jgi:hypothetical protein
LGSKPLFAWISILGSCDILKEGLYNRIGNGENTRIWGDKWIPISSTYVIQSPPRLLDATSTVSELIDRDMMEWKKDLLEALFNYEEIKAILLVPLSNTNTSDVVIWQGNKNGIFTVKSAYHIDAAINRDNQEFSK